MRILKLVLFLLLVLTIGVAHAQEERTVGTIFGEHEGYTLFTPLQTPFVFLINSDGYIVNQWEPSGASLDAFLKPNGNLVVSAPLQTPVENNFTGDLPFVTQQGRFEEYTWDGELVWAWEFARPDYRVHHGFNLMPNGHILFIAFHYKSIEEAVAAGRNPELLGEGLWTEVFLEYSPEDDAIVWEWHLWDHLIQDFDPTQANYGDVAANPQKLDINFFEPAERIEDWIHVNALDYNAELDQVLVSAREFNEVWVLDHSINTEEAQGAAGDVLYRWGNPAAYRRGTESDHQIYYQHDVQWIADGLIGAGNIIAFSNRQLAEDGTEFSRVVEFTPPVQADGTYPLADGQAFAPAEPTWIYQSDPVTEFYSNFISGIQRLRNGNTLIIEGGEGRMFEVTADGTIVWEYIQPLDQQGFVPQGFPANSRIFRARRYEADFSGFEGRDLTPTVRLEDYAEPREEATEAPE